MTPEQYRSLADDHAAASPDWSADDWIDWERDAAIALRDAANVFESVRRVAFARAIAANAKGATLQERYWLDLIHVLTSEPLSIAQVKKERNKEFAKVWQEGMNAALHAKFPNNNPYKN